MGFVEESKNSDIRIGDQLTGFFGIAKGLHLEDKVTLFGGSIDRMEMPIDRKEMALADMNKQSRSSTRVAMMFGQFQSG